MYEDAGRGDGSKDVLMAELSGISKLGNEKRLNVVIY